MNNLLVWALKWILAVCLQLRYPTVRFQEEEAVRKDPSYEIYETYRYAYKQYGYLFSYAEETEKDKTAAGENGTTDGENRRTNEENGTGNEENEIASRENGIGNVENETTSREEGSVNGADSSLFLHLKDYDYLMKHYFSVHASTTADRGLMKAEQLLGTDVKLEKNPKVPQILIYHTHASEEYADYGPKNPDATVVGAGAYLTELLQARGWNVIHDTTAYDQREGKLERSRAYTYALEGIQRILQEHPTIEVILDLHRDGVAESVRLVQEIQGKPTARIMFFQGMSRTPEGEIAYLPNPYLQENLAFSFQMQLALSRYPGFTRKIYLKGLRYNLHLRGRSSLIEAGAQTNTIEEARNAMELLAEAIDTVLYPAGGDVPN